MSGITASQSRRTSPLMVIPVHCLVVLLRRCGQDTEPMRLLPLRRHPSSVLPLVSCGTGATEKLNNLWRGVWGKVFGEAHGRILPQEKKCAMQKINLDKCPQCRQIACVSQPQNNMKTETAIITAAVLGTIAFNEGRTAVPAHDPELLKVIGQHEKKEMGASLPILKAWVNSWHAANLAQTV